MKKAKQQYTIQLDSDFVAKVDKMADSLGLSRSQMMRNLMESGYEDAAMLERVGLFAAFKLGDKLIRKIKEGIASGKITFDKDGEIEIKKK